MSLGSWRDAVILIGRHAGSLRDDLLGSVQVCTVHVCLWLGHQGGATTSVKWFSSKKYTMCQNAAPSRAMSWCNFYQPTWILCVCLGHFWLHLIHFQMLKRCLCGERAVIHTHTHTNPSSVFDNTYRTTNVPTQTPPTRTQTHKRNTHAHVLCHWTCYYSQVNKLNCKTFFPSIHRCMCQCGR